MYGLYRLWTQHKLRVPNFRTSGWSGEAERRAQSVVFFSDERPSQSGREIGFGESHGREFCRRFRAQNELAFRAQNGLAFRAQYIFLTVSSPGEPILGTECEPILGTENCIKILPHCPR